ncbi:hypothetical protein [Pseudomonas sp. TE50-2]|uniref:hypothetical protein n=1 Tax=Pseudomonas sp. TE50-2 TaxID=3142707 RepID=UPI00346567AF
MMRKTPQFPIFGHPMYMDAVDAMKLFHEVQAMCKAAEQIKRLRLFAEAQFQAVNDYQLKASGGYAGHSH